MATLVLTALGTAIGGPLGGAIGGLIGSSFDQAVLFKPKGREGRRLTDLQLQTSTYGVQLPKLFGTMRAAGSVIWATDLKEKKNRSGGGKGRPSVTSYSYSASFAVALSARRVRAVRRIWADGNLLRGAAGDFKTGLNAFRLHLGDEDQAADPLIASAEGIDRTPAHRGIAYAVFEDLQLADYGNRIPSLTFEVDADDEPVTLRMVSADLSEELLSAEAEEEVGGFAAGGADVADAIGPLVEAWNLAFVADEGGLRLTGANGEDEPAEISAAALCVRANGRVVDPLEQSGEGTDAAPLALSLRHYDPARDYQAGVQRVSRPGSGRVEQGIELPVTMTADTARQLAARRLGHSWAGRSSMTLRCGWEALRHQAGDLVTVEGQRGRWRIEEREWEAMAVRLALRHVPGAGGVPPVGASSGVIVRQADAPHGPTSLMLIDLPPLREAAAAAPVIVAAASGGEGWKSAALFTMSEGGEAFPVGFTAPRAIMGQAVEALGEGSCTLIDAVNMVHVTLIAPDMELGDADEVDLAHGRNLCLLGKELLQFSQAVQTGAATFRLEGLRRGLCGTEWAMTHHDPGERFLLIEEERLMEPPLIKEIGGALRLAAVGIGDAEPVEATLTVSGEAVTPIAPVHMRAAPDGSGGLAISWVRRSRIGWRWAGGADVPLGEESERYELRVTRGGDLLRRAETTSPVWSYDAAAIDQDGEGMVVIEVRQIGAFALGKPGRIKLSL
jgi:hypothetical protein